jgi:hypothetical protein
MDNVQKVCHFKSTFLDYDMQCENSWLVESILLIASQEELCCWAILLLLLLYHAPRYYFVGSESPATHNLTYKTDSGQKHCIYKQPFLLFAVT